MKTHTSLMKVIDIGYGIFENLIEIDFSRNQINQFKIRNDIALNANKLKILNLSHNNISGALTRSDLDVFHRNLTVDLSFNKISNINLIMTKTDIKDCVETNKPTYKPYRTRFKVEENEIDVFSTSSVNEIPCDCNIDILRKDKCTRGNHNLTFRNLRKVIIN